MDSFFLLIKSNNFEGLTVSRVKLSKSTVFWETFSMPMESKYFGKKTSKNELASTMIKLYITTAISSLTKVWLFVRRIFSSAIKNSPCKSFLKTSWKTNEINEITIPLI